MPLDNPIPVIYGIEECFDGIDIDLIELVILFRKLLSG